MQQELVRGHVIVSIHTHIHTYIHTYICMRFSDKKFHCCHK